MRLAFFPQEVGAMILDYLLPTCTPAERHLEKEKRHEHERVSRERGSEVSS